MRGGYNTQMTTPVNSLNGDDDFEIIEKIEGDLFITCPYCEPPELIYKDKLGVHQAFAHGRSIREVFEEEDREAVDEDEAEVTAFDIEFV